jgi:hypothetical protein
MVGCLIKKPRLAGLSLVFYWENKTANRFKSSTKRFENCPDRGTKNLKPAFIAGFFYFIQSLEKAVGLLEQKGATQLFR